MFIMNRRHLIIPALAALLAFSCNENSEDQAELLLSADRQTVYVGESVTFEVKFASVQDVSRQSSIKCVETGKAVENLVFQASEAGDWSFQAAHEGLLSNIVSIHVEELASELYKRTVCVMEFTGQWCSQCPTGATTINYYATEVYPERMCIMAFHNANGGNEDIFEIPQEAVLYSMFEPGGYPGYVLDMSLSGTVNSGTFGESLAQRMKAASYSRLELSSSASGDEITVDVELESLISAAYRLAVYVIEDKIVAKQNNGGKYVDDYTHRHVVRRMLSEAVQGDKLGTATAGGKLSKSYSFTPEPSWNRDNLSVCVLSIAGDGTVDNSAECKINK